MNDLKEKNLNYYKYDVVVIGGGHAGCEAALSSARNGARTIIITINMDSIALMACNSAVGGPGRGQMVREMDVIGGEMAKNVDRTFIHSRVLNTSKGPALRTIRAIVDKKNYFLSMKKILENQENLYLKQGLAVEIKKRKKNYSVRLSDETYYECKSVVIATGTFLRAKIFWGDYWIEAGRQGEINSKRLARSIESLGHRFGRLRTETPPRVDKKTVDFSRTAVQHHDENPSMFSYDNVYDGRRQLDSYLTYLNRDGIEYITENINKSSIVNKDLKSQSPKYCPSIEDKVRRFYKKDRHPVFIQPEGIKTNEMYLHGLFTAFSEDVQDGLIKKIRGLEDAVITRPGYGVEYDYLKPYQINVNLESKNNMNLFFAGQINGTTGYEEAAAQGLIAGINAALRATGRDSLLIERQDGYIGVLLDDIAVRGVTEPYRMLTSRDELRILHRHDNADIRMVKFLDKLGLNKKADKILNKYERVDFAINKIRNDKSYNKNFFEDLRQDNIDRDSINSLKKKFSLDDAGIESLIIDIKYDVYLNRELNRIKNLNLSDSLEIPAGTDYRKIKNISNEAISSFARKKPKNVSQAARLEGVRPPDILSLIAYIKNVSRET